MGGPGSGEKPTLEALKLRARVCSYRRRYRKMSVSEIARRHGISRQLAHKILKNAGVLHEAER
jgi:transposase-like protein